MGLKVTPEQLRASGQAADAVAQDLVSPMEKAVTTATSAGSSMSGWSIGGELTELGHSWQGALHGLHRRMREGAENLRLSADHHESNDRLISTDFEKMAPVSGGPTTPFG